MLFRQRLTKQICPSLSNWLLGPRWY